MLIQILQNTPLWVFVLFKVLLVLGILQSKQRRVSATRLVVLPISMIGLSLYGVGAAYGMSGAGFGAWLSGMTIALALNHFLQQPRQVSYSSTTRSFSVPGSWVPLLLMMGIFFTKYAVGVALVRNPLLREVGAFVVASSLLYGFFSGMFVARALQILRSGRAASTTTPSAQCA